jgi:hypothetical protein
LNLFETRNIFIDFIVLWIIFIIRLLMDHGFIFKYICLTTLVFLFLKINGVGLKFATDFHEANLSVLFTSLLKNVTYETIYAPCFHADY